MSHIYTYYYYQLQLAFCYHPSCVYVCIYAPLLALLSTLSPKAIAFKTYLERSTISKICSKHCPNLQKSSGGHPSKLSSTTICHSIHLISIGKLDTATQVAKELSNSHQVSVLSKTVCRTLRKQGMKATTKIKKAKLEPHHAKARL